MRFDYRSSRNQPSRKTLRYKYIFILIVIVGVFWAIRNINFGRRNKIDSPLVQEANSIGNGQVSSEQLLMNIRDVVSSKPGSYSVYVVDFSTGESLGLNENMIFTAASINKIPILAVLYHLAQKGEIDLDQTITLQAKDIQDFGTGTMRYDPVGTVYSLKTLARLMIEKSDNTAGYILGEQIIGLDKIQDYLTQWGLTQTDMKMNKTSNRDMAKLFKMIYSGEIADQSLTAEMIDFMDDSDYENRIPAQLPEDISVYHKIGNEIRNTHDVGIVDLTGKPYYIGVLISDNANEEDSISTIASISKMVFDYFSGG